MKRKTTVCWTNWTFGFWSYKFRTNGQTYGIDLGPLEIVWKEK